MRQFQFQLKLRDGRIVAANAVAERWQWSQAFATACRQVEAELGLGPWSGIVCVGYESAPASPIIALAVSAPVQSLPSAA